ncbi:unnamed protein product, partial [Meganyctiphanes norvegica]
RTNWHDNVGKEVDLVMNTAGVIDLTPFSKLIVQGPQAAAFLDYVAANNVPREGRIVISHMLTPNGQVMAELTITKTGPDTFLIITGSGVELHDLRWLQEQARLGDWDVSFVNVTEDLGVLSVAGPRAKDVMKALQPDFPDKFPFFAAKKPRGNETVHMANKVVGNTTSGGYSYYLGKPLAFMYLPPLLTTPGTTVQVELMNELYNAKVLPGPPMETALARNKKKSTEKQKRAVKI